jgi:hypothetical protein
MSSTDQRSEPFPPILFGTGRDSKTFTFSYAPTGIRTRVAAFLWVLTQHPATAPSTGLHDRPSTLSGLSNVFQCSIYTHLLVQNASSNPNHMIPSTQFHSEKCGSFLKLSVENRCEGPRVRFWNSKHRCRFGSILICYCKGNRGTGTG